MSWVCSRCDASVRDELGACPVCSPSRSADAAALRAPREAAAAPREAHMSLVPKATAPQRKYQYNDQNFNAFYALWPRKRSKEAALRAWHAALRAGASPSAIIDGAAREAQRVKRLGIELRHVPYPATWLNAAGWLDEDDSAPAVGESDPARIVGTPEYDAARAAEEEVAIAAFEVPEDLRSIVDGIGGGA